MQTFSSNSYNYRYIGFLFVLGLSIGILIYGSQRTMNVQRKITSLIKHTTVQKGLSQHMSINLLKIIESKNDRQKEEYFKILEQNLKELADTHQNYIHIDREYNILKDSAEEIREALYNADLVFHSIQIYEEELKVEGDTNFHRVKFETRYVHEFLQLCSDYFTLMDKLLTFYSRENSKNISIQGILGWAGHIVTLVIFILIVFFIYNPIQKKVMTLYDELLRSNRTLVSQNDDLELYKLMIEKSADPIFLLDMDDGFRMVFVNEAAVKHFGVPRDEILKWTLPDWDPGFKTSDLADYYDRVKDRVAAVLETTHKTRNGLVPVEISLNKIRYRDHLCHFGYFKDISERKKATEELIKAKDEAEIASRAKSDFLSNMSHEIRTPMNAVIGFTHLLKHTSLNNRQMDYLEKVEGASKSLLGLINDILDISKIEAGKITIEDAEFSLGEIIKNLSAMFSVLSREKPIEVIFDVDSYIQDNYRGDSLRLLQVFINMMNNAVKFTEKGEILLKIRGQDKGEIIELEIEIRDSGIGMDSKQLARLFNPFEQADASITRRFGGTGLGLYITRQLVELMKGSIRIESELTIGTTVFIRLPLKKLVPPIPQEGRVPQELQGLSVVYLENNGTSRKVMKSMFDHLGWSSVITERSSDAIEEIKKSGQAYDAIFISYQLNEDNVIDLVGKIKTCCSESSNRKSRAPVMLLVSSYSDPELWDKAEKAAIDGLLIKPITIKGILESLQPFMEKNFRYEKSRESPYQNKLNGVRILSVEDNPINSEILVELISQMGGTVETVSSGFEAVENYEDGKFDIVLMDVQMPGMDGLETSQKLIKKSDRKIPILALTANILPEDIKRYNLAGMVDVISKPVDIKVLYDKIRYWTNPDGSSSERG